MDLTRPHTLKTFNMTVQEQNKISKMKIYLSHSPATKSKLSARWHKSVKNTKSIGGKIVANAFGDTKQEAELNAQKIVQLWNRSEKMPTEPEIEMKLLEIFNRAEIKQDIKDATKFIINLITQTSATEADYLATTHTNQEK